MSGEIELQVWLQVTFHRFLQIESPAMDAPLQNKPLGADEQLVGDEGGGETAGDQPCS